MRELAFRLLPGEDLKNEIENRLKNEGLCVVLSSVGSLCELHLRLAGARDFLRMSQDLEIVSLNGTIAKGEAHLHICVADSTGKTYGGHLKDGCIVSTTAEIVVGIMEEYDADRQMDQQTGYKEIIFRKV